jgi:hypothetical protein
MGPKCWHDCERMKTRNHDRPIRSLYLFFVAVVSALICGCTCATPTPGSGQADKEKEHWRIELAVSGGFAGVSKHLEIDSSGKARAMDRKRGLERESRATPQMVARLGRLINELFSTPPSLEQKPKKRCYDCFEYQLTVISGEKTRIVKISGFPDKSSIKWQLIRSLAPFMDQALTNRRESN